MHSPRACGFGWAPLFGVWSVHTVHRQPGFYLNKKRSNSKIQFNSTIQFKSSIQFNSQGTLVVTVTTPRELKRRIDLKRRVDFNRRIELSRRVELSREFKNKFVHQHSNCNCKRIYLYKWIHTHIIIQYEQVTFLDMTDFLRGVCRRDQICEM